MFQEKSDSARSGQCLSNLRGRTPRSIGNPNKLKLLIIVAHTWCVETTIRLPQSHLEPWCYMS